jgi:hypothetical protein
VRSGVSQLRSSDSKIAITSLVALSTWLFVVLPLIYLPKQAAGTFLGFDNTAWTAIGAIAGLIYCALTAGLLIFAVYQVRSARADAKITRTLAACDRYDFDPILDRVTNRIAEALVDGTLEAFPRDYNLDMESLFNYFESIAIGVSKGLYDKDIVCDQLKPIIIEHVDDLIISGVSGWKGNPDKYYEHMMRLYREWKTG